MRSKKNIFGYQSGLRKLRLRSISDWVDVSVFTLKGEGVYQDEDGEKPRFLWPRLLLMVMIVVLGGRLAVLQIARGQENQLLADGNRVRQQITVAPRGLIFDRKGTPLVLNQPGYSLDVVPADLPRAKAERTRIFEQIARETQLSLDTVEKKIHAAGLSSFDPVTLQQMPREQAIMAKIKFAATPGIRIAFTPIRQYESVIGLSHVLGYTSRMTERDLEKHPDYYRASPIGRSGVEASYDADLRGKVGISEVEVNADGQYQRMIDQTAPQIGKNLYLTLDKGLQIEMGEALKEAMAKNNAHQAVGIAMNPTTGGILASVSLPDYDNNLFVSALTPEKYQELSNHPDKPFLNRSVDGVYPAGSTIKPFITAAALQEKTISPSTTLDTSAGVIKIGQWEFPDWKKHGMTDYRRSIWESNDIWFYALGGGWKIYKIVLREESKPTATVVTMTLTLKRE